MVLQPRFEGVSERCGGSATLAAAVERGISPFMSLLPCCWCPVVEQAWGAADQRRVPQRLRNHCPPDREKIAPARCRQREPHVTLVFESDDGFNEV